jgi:hypothetical protein
MIVLYPERVQAQNEKQSQKLTASYEAMPRSGEKTRVTEKTAMRSTGGTVGREMEAVRLALEEVSKLPDGEDRLKMIDLLYWQQSVDFEGAGQRLHVSSSTIQRWSRRFVYSVARNFGLLDV